MHKLYNYVNICLFVDFFHSSNSIRRTKEKNEHKLLTDDIEDKEKEKKTKNSKFGAQNPLPVVNVNYQANSRMNER